MIISWPGGKIGSRSALQCRRYNPAINELDRFAISRVTDPRRASGRSSVRSRFAIAKPMPAPAPSRGRSEWKRETYQAAWTGTLYSRSGGTHPFLGLTTWSSIPARTNETRGFDT